MQIERDNLGDAKIAQGFSGPGDGRMVHDMYLFEVKKPSESKNEWDLYKLIATVPGDEAFRPLDKGGCPLVTH